MVDQQPLQILLADDHPDAMEAVGYFLSSYPWLRVVGKVESGEKAVELARSRPVDLVIMDLVMPGMNGLEATRLLKALPQPPRVVVVTLYTDTEHRVESMEAGADAFIGKSEITTRLIPTIRKLFPTRQTQ